MLVAHCWKLDYIHNLRIYRIGDLLRAETVFRLFSSHWFIQSIPWTTNSRTTVRTQILLPKQETHAKSFLMLVCPVPTSAHRQASSFSEICLSLSGLVNVSRLHTSNVLTRSVAVNQSRELIHNETEDMDAFAPTRNFAAEYEQKIRCISPDLKDSSDVYTHKYHTKSAQDWKFYCSTELSWWKGRDTRDRSRP